MKNKWALLLALSAVIFSLSHCGSGVAPSVPPPKTLETETELDLKTIECLSGVYKGIADLRFDFDFKVQNVTVSIAFSGPNALVQVNGEDGDALCTHYAGFKTEDNNGVVALSASEITSNRTEGSGTAYLFANASENIPQSFGNITLTFPKEETTQPAQNTEETTPAQQPAAQSSQATEKTSQENAQDQNKCRFKIASFEELDSTPEGNTIDSQRLKQDPSQSADYNTLLNACGGAEGFTIKLPSSAKEEDGENTAPTLPHPGPHA